MEISVSTSCARTEPGTIQIQTNRKKPGDIFDTVELQDDAANDVHQKNKPFDAKVAQRIKDSPMTLEGKSKKPKLIKS